MGRAQPSAVRTVIAIVVAVVGSIAACAVLAALGPIVFPRTAGYEHYAFADYAKLTTIGVIGAGIGWPIVTLFSTRAARLYLWLAIWWKGQDGQAVFVLIVMHVAVAAVTYPAMVFIAPQRRRA
jgi:hypothetical protein